MKSPIWNKLIWIILILCGVLVSIKSLREPDVWWMMATGDWILANGSAPYTDMFSLTNFGIEWINVKWGFEVLLVFFRGLGGPEFTPFLQAIFNTALLFSIYAYWKHFSNKKELTPGIGLALLAFIVLSEYRMLGRPEMVSHLFTALFLYILYSHHKKANWVIWMLIPLQVVWTNMHEAFGMGMVLTVAFTAAKVFDYLFADRLLYSKSEFPKKLLMVSAGVFIAPALHPYGSQMILHPFNIFGQVMNNRFTSESFQYSDAAYWQFQAYAWIVILIIALLSLFILNKSAGVKWFSRPFQKWGSSYPLLLVMFAYLSLTGLRNIPFFFIVATPILAIALDEFGIWVSSKIKTTNKVVAYTTTLVLGMLFYMAVGSGWWYKTTNSHDTYGLRLAPAKNPVGAANFIQKNNISGAAFSDYLVSSYLLHELSPAYKSYIDLRDMDIFSPEDFKHYFAVSQSPEEYFEIEAEKYNFTHVILYRPQFDNLHTYLYYSNNWVLVYMDAVATVYLKNNEQNRALINTYAITEESGDAYRIPQEPKASNIAAAISNLFWPFYNEENAEGINHAYEAARFYTQIGLYRTALSAAVEAATQEARGFIVLGDVYRKLGETEKNSEFQLRYFEESKKAYVNALNEISNCSECHLGLGLLYLATKALFTAEKQILKALALDDEMLNAYLGLAEVQLQMSIQSPGSSGPLLKNWVKYMEQAVNLDPYNPDFAFKLAGGYCRLSRCSEAVPLIKKHINFPGNAQADIDYAKSCLKKCKR